MSPKSVYRPQISSRSAPVYIFGAHSINLYIVLVTGMADIDGNTHLDLLFQKVLRHEHHRKNLEKVFQTI